MRAAALILFLFAMHTVCRAENDSCPWINNATAFGILGASEDSPMASAAACSFTYHDGGIMRELRITVEQATSPQQAFRMYKSHCHHERAMRGIGNEAVMCSMDEKQEHGERVVGCVRDNVFTISLSAGVNDASLSKDALKEKIGIAAEQVSGNLF